MGGLFVGGSAVEGLLCVGGSYGGALFVGGSAVGGLLLVGGSYGGEGAEEGGSAAAGFEV